MKLRLTTLTRFFLYSAVLFLILALALMTISARAIHDSFIYQTTLSVATSVQQASYNLKTTDFAATDEAHTRQVFGTLWQEIRTNDIIRIKVWDSNARVIYSNDESIIGQRFPDNHEYLEALQGNAVSEIGEPVEAENISEAGYQQLLEVYVPVSFDDSARPVGVVEAYTKLDLVNAQIAQTQRIIAVAIAAFTLATFILLFIFFQRSVYRPINQLKDTAAKIETGDFKQRVAFRAPDEIGQLAQSFNSMAAKLESYYLSLEEKVRDRTARLGESEFRYQRLFETAQDGIMLLDAETGEIMQVNPVMEKLLGVDKSELLGKALWEVPAFAQDNLGREAFGELQAKGMVSLNDVSLKTNSGEVIIEFIGKAYNVDGREFIQCNIRDISERRRSEERKRELDELKTTFIKIISHQLRTPLGAIRWNLEEILSGGLGKVPPGQAQILSVINKANLEVITRINDMITALDIEEGRIHLEKSPTPLESLVQTVVGELQGMAESKKISLKLDLPSEPLPPVSIDPVRIREVIFKLIDNALTYTPDNGQVVLTLSRLDKKVRFEVADNGKGIPEAEQARLFQRFHRASNAYTMKSDASGLGLYIAKHFIEAHQGVIGFKSREGEGSSFWFELPL